MAMGGGWGLGRTQAAGGGARYAWQRVPRGFAGWLRIEAGEAQRLRWVFSCLGWLEGRRRELQGLG